MLTLARVRYNITIPKVLALSCVLLAACTSEQILQRDTYDTAYSEIIHVVAKSGLRYELYPPWTSDEVGNLTGDGRAISDDGWEWFTGSIAATEIETVTTGSNFNSKPALTTALTLTGAVAILVGLGLLVLSTDPWFN